MNRSIKVSVIIGAMACVLYLTGPSLLGILKRGPAPKDGVSLFENPKERNERLARKEKENSADVGKQHTTIKGHNEEGVSKKLSYINPEGMTIQERYLLPDGYTRKAVEEGSFGEFLRNQRLKPYGEKALYYDGREKPSEGKYDGVIDVDIGTRDLHQCADAIMLLRGEYLYSKGSYGDIYFNFVSGFQAEYKKWMEGYRIKVDGNNVKYYKASEPSNSYRDFRDFMDMVMAYASTLSLEKELQPIEIEDIDIGDVFIIGGSPGHAVIVADMAQDEDNKKIFLLAQSYMPAQQTQILINPMDNKLSPWYSLEGKDRLITPEWRFELDQLKGFQ